MYSAVTRPPGAEGTGQAPRSTISPQLLEQFQQLLQDVRSTKVS